MNICTLKKFRKIDKALIFILFISLLSIAALLHNSIPHSYSRFRDFDLISKALESYKNDHNLYPTVEGGVAYFDGTKNLGAVNWIPGLYPKYLLSIPLDPYKSKYPNHQYVYFSNGLDYKFIAHGPEDVSWIAKIYPNLIDPVRSDIAYGIWTQGGD